MEKLSAAQVGVIVKTAAEQLRAQAETIVALQSRIASYERREHAEKIASVAVSRGIMEEDDAEAYASELAASSEDLNTVERFVGRAASGAPLGNLDKTASVNADVGGTDVLTAFLLGTDI